MIINKKELYFKSIEKVNEKIAQYQKEMDLIKESMDANDVQNGYDEENRGQLLGDFEKHAEHLNHAQKMKEELSRIDQEHHTTKIDFGSIVETENNYYFIAAAIGEVYLEEGSTVYVISTEAPIYKEMKGKEKGESFSFNNKQYTIQTVN